VEDIKDVRSGMILEGTVTNVANFGAFVDIGVHQDGLVHISALAEHFVKDPHSVVKAGDVVKVRVVDVDLQRRRIGLSMRLSDGNNDGRDATPKRHRSPENKPSQGPGRRHSRSDRATAGGAMADAFAKARKGRD